MKLVIGGFLLSFWAGTSSFNINPGWKMAGCYALLLGLFLITDHYSNGKIMQVVFNGGFKNGRKQPKRSNENLNNKI